MSGARVAGAVCSVLIHLGVLFALLLTPTRHHKPPQKGVTVSLPDANSTGHLRGETVGAGLSCGGYHYTGVGLMYSTGGRIIDVGPDTPASRAGLVDGDILIDLDQLMPDRFEVGHTVQLRVLRAGREIVLPITIGRICNEN